MQVAEIHFDLSIQHYFLSRRLAASLAVARSEEFTDSDPDNPAEGIYIPIWMPLAELAEHENVYPADVAIWLLSLSMLVGQTSRLSSWRIRNNTLSLQGAVVEQG